MNNTGSTCICRVPKAQLKEGTVVECPHCGEALYYSALTNYSLLSNAMRPLRTGCRGCSSDS